MEELIKKLRKFIEELGNKKLMYNLFIILLISIMVLLGTSILKDSKKKPSTFVLNNDNFEYNNKIEEDYSSFLEAKLAKILSKMKGVGEVSVMITLESSTESIPAINTSKTTENTNEIDSEGGKREVIREEETVQLANISSEVVILKEVKPIVKGVIVVAEGVEDSIVLENLYNAVKTVLGVSSNKVQVYFTK